ncbi:hypothetical protein LY76DRAFT_18458 [Colletotrichum caudatum]|nr:hypothetical protein LY76DRAFT_18458 [Colletotrichum caudatum]
MPLSSLWPSHRCPKVGFFLFFFLSLSLSFQLLRICLVVPISLPVGSVDTSHTRALNLRLHHTNLASTTRTGGWPTDPWKRRNWSSGREEFRLAGPSSPPPLSLSPAPLLPPVAGRRCAKGKMGRQQRPASEKGSKQQNLRSPHPSTVRGTVIRDSARQFVECR